MSDDSAVPSFLHAAAGGAGGIVALSMLYPMDNLRTRMQVQQDSLPSMELAQQEAVIVSELKRVLQMASTSKRANPNKPPSPSPALSQTPSAFDVELYLG